MEWRTPPECSSCGRTIPENETFQSLCGRPTCKRCRNIPASKTPVKTSGHVAVSAVFCPVCLRAMEFSGDKKRCMCNTAKCPLRKKTYFFSLVGEIVLEEV